MIAQMARSPFVSDAYTRAHFQLHVYRVTQVGLAHLRAAADPMSAIPSFVWRWRRSAA